MMPLQQMVNVATDPGRPHDAVCDFSMIPEEWPAFEGVVLTYVLSGCSPIMAEAIVQSVSEHVRPGGEIWIIEGDLRKLAARYHAGLICVGEFSEVALIPEVGVGSLWDGPSVADLIRPYGYEEIRQRHELEFPFGGLQEEPLLLVSARKV